MKIEKNSAVIQCTSISHSQILFYVQAEEEEVHATEEVPSSLQTEFGKLEA